MKWKTFNNLVTEIKDEDKITIAFIIDSEKKQINCTKNEFLKTIWNIYENKDYILRLDIYTGSKLLYQFISTKFETNKLKIDKTTNTLIKNWKRLPIKKKKTLLKILESQIING